MISLSQLANTKFLLLYFLIFLPPSTLSIIIFFYLASLLTLVSLVLQFLSSYLSNRSQSVSIQSHLSPSAPISTGVPQGSVLGPLLFCLYTTPLTYQGLNPEEIGRAHV